MIDDSDGDFALLASLSTPGFLGAVLLIVAIVLWIIAAQNSSECESKSCDNGQHAELLDHECVCVGGKPR